MEHPLAAAAASSRPAPPRVLIIEDDRHLANVVERYLEREGFEIDVVHDGEAGLQRALEWLPDLVVLDLMLPRLDGLEVFRRLRRVAPVPVVMLTARGSEEDRVAGLELGADDYVAKPFSPRELTARVRAVLRRAAGPVDDRGASVLRAGDLEIDLVAHQARRGGTPLPLTAKELDLLCFLLAHPRRAFGRDELLRAVWGYEIGDTATVTVHVQRLRDKIEAEPRSPRHLVTVRGVGYRFDP